MTSKVEKDCKPVERIGDQLHQRGYIFLEFGREKGIKESRRAAAAREADRVMTHPKQSQPSLRRFLRPTLRNLSRIVLKAMKTSLKRIEPKSCLIVPPAERSVDDFRLIKEFLLTFRDAILAHKPLWIDGQILHLDIFASNIVIARTKTLTGILIDLDLAKEHGSFTGLEHFCGLLIRVYLGVNNARFIWDSAVINVHHRDSAALKIVA